MQARMAVVVLTALAIPSSISGLAAQNLLEPPPVSEPTEMGEQPGVLRPAPDVHGRSGQGVQEQHGNDAASPGGSIGASDVSRAEAARIVTPEEQNPALPTGGPFEGQALAPRGTAE